MLLGDRMRVSAVHGGAGGRGIARSIEDISIEGREDRV